VETDSVQNVVVHKAEAVTAGEVSVGGEHADVEKSVVEAAGAQKGASLEKSLEAKGSPRRRRRRRFRRRRRRRRFRRRRRRRRRRRTPSPTAAPTPVPTAAPTPVPTVAPTVKAGKGKGGSLMEVEDYDSAEDDVVPSTAEEAKAYFSMVDLHLQNSNKLEGEGLEGDPILIFCNGQPYEMDPSAGVKTPEQLATEWGRSLVNGNEGDLADEAEDKGISLTMSAPRIGTISTVLSTSTVPADGQLTIWFNGEQEPDEAVRNMDATTAKQYGLSVTWLAGMELASL